MVLGASMRQLTTGLPQGQAVFASVGERQFMFYRSH